MASGNCAVCQFPVAEDDVRRGAGWCRILPCTHELHEACAIECMAGFNMAIKDMLWTCLRNCYGEVKPKAGVSLAVYSLTRHACEVCFGGIPNVEAKRQSFEALCRVLDAILDMKRGRADNWQFASKRLFQLQMQHMTLHKAAYGTSLIIPKHHAAFHLGPQFSKDQLVIDMFVIERCNIKFKNVAENVKCTSRFERSVVASMATAQVNALNDEEKEGLIGRPLPFPPLVNSFYARGARAIDFAFYEQDVVMCRDKAGLVAMAVQQGGKLLLLVRLLRTCGWKSETSAKYIVTDQLQYFDVDSAMAAAAWYADAESIVVLW